MRPDLILLKEGPNVVCGVCVYPGLLSNPHEYLRARQGTLSILSPSLYPSNSFYLSPYPSISFYLSPYPSISVSPSLSILCISIPLSVFPSSLSLYPSISVFPSSLSLYPPISVFPSSLSLYPSISGTLSSSFLQVSNPLIHLADFVYLIFCRNQNSYC